MARIRMKNTSKESVQEVFLLFLSASAGKGVKNKTIDTFKQHFHAISKRLNVEAPLSSLTEADLNAMIRQMREDGLADTSINSYTRTLKVFLSWCNEQGRTELNLPIYKAAEAVKETYSGEELLLLLKKPEAGCGFCEFRNWTIINFLLNSGCRASTVRAIQNQDVDLVRRQILFRHTKNGKIQMIPLCSSMVSILRDYMAVRGGGSTDYLFPNEFGNMLTENALRLAQDCRLLCEKKIALTNCICYKVSSLRTRNTLGGSFMRKIVCLLLMLVLICNVGALSVSADTFGVNIKVCREHGVYIEAKCPKCTKKKNEKNSSGSTSGSIGTGIHSRNDDLPKASDTWDHKDEAEFPWWLITGGHRAEDGLIPIFVCSNGSGPVLPY